MSVALLRRSAAALVLLLATLPLYTLLRFAGAGYPGMLTAALAADYAGYLWSATLLLAAFALLAGRIVPESAAARAAGAVGEALARPRTLLFATAAGLLAAALAWYINRHVLYGEPNLIDAVSQLVHARYFAAGRLAGPVSAFWHIQQTLATEHGWVSQYPPGHVAVLALGLRLGAVELVGPVVLGFTVALTCALAHRLFPGPRVLARLATLLLALSPFAAAHAAAYLSHTTAALFSVCAIYCALRTTEARGGWFAAGLGLALALLFATRPLTGLVVGAVAAVQLAGGFSGRFVRPRMPVVLAAAAAAAPVLLLLGAYNAHFFGSPFRFGYTVALGPDGGIGFGTDPWGNGYGIIAAIGYTAAELGTLNLFLAETPLPLVSLAALYLLLAPRLTPAVRLCAAWALLPLAAHLFYWHHGLHMGPRMLNEYTPAWALLVVAAAAGLLRAAPSALPRLPGWSPRALLGVAFLGAAGFALGSGIPRRIESYRRPVVPVQHAAAQLPQPSLVFLHGTWAARLAMQLAADGMRLDSLETVMRRNSTCAVQQWYEDGRPEGRLDLQRVMGGVPNAEAAPGSRIRRVPGEPWPQTCAQQAAADSFGLAEVAAHLWRSGLPGIDDERSLLVRDLGPAANARLIRALRRPAYVLELFPQDGRLALQPYGPAMARIWRGAP